MSPTVVSQPVKFGPIVTGTAVEKAVAVVLEERLSNYLGELERIEGYEPNAIERPRGFVTASELEKWPEDQIPVIVIVSAATERPIKRAHGDYEATWNLGVAPVVSDVNADETRKLALAYVAAVRACLVQHKRLRSNLHPSGFSEATHWESEHYDGIAFGETRTLLAPRVMFNVTVLEAVNSQAGPREPYEPPDAVPSDWPIVESITVKADPERRE
jgi:hypothetical protein